ncbi:hypothetical protein TNCV_2455381 [Trichonephila clavipes]|nr:hypothetical protein TNCV_2455381 [Trichonephila clavipes]
MTRSVAKSPRVAEQCDVNVQSLTEGAHGPRNSELQSCEGADTPISKLPHHTYVRTYNLDSGTFGKMDE